MRKYLLAIVAIFGLMASYPANVGEPLLTQCDNQALILPVGVLIMEPEDVQKYHDEITDKRTLPRKRVAAFHMTAPVTTADGTVFEEAHVIVVPPLRGQKDYQRMVVWGHELGHLACGPYHDESE